MAAPASARRYAVALAVVLACVLAPTALAQLPGPTVAVKLDQTQLSLGAANTTTVTATVTYSDQVPGSTPTITVATQAPDGWKATASPATLAGSGTVTITLVAPAAHNGAATGNLQVSVNANAGAGRTPATASATLALTRVDPAPVPPPNYTPLIVGVVVAVLVVAAGVALALRRRSQRLAREAAEAAAAAEKAAFLARETGITIELVDGPLPFGDKREAIYRVRVTNASDRPRIAVIGVKDVPDGWRAAPSIPRLPLSPKESVVVSVYVNPAPTVAWGEKATLVVTARPEEAQELSERVAIEAAAPAVRIPVVDDSPAAVQHREDIRTSRFILRR